MKIAQLMTGSSVDFEQRKRALQRREMGEAYKKTQQYQSVKNPLLAALENLLSGKTEKELHVSDQMNRDEQETVAQHESNTYRKEWSIQPLNELAYTATDNETMNSLERVKAATLTPTEAILQDVRSATHDTVKNGNGQHEATSTQLAHLAQEELPVDQTDFEVNIPTRDATKQGTLMVDYRGTLRQRTFMNASAKYNQHMAMVKNGYRSPHEAQFSKIA